MDRRARERAHTPSLRPRTPPSRPLDPPWPGSRLIHRHQDLVSVITVLIFVREAGEGIPIAQWRPACLLFFSFFLQKGSHPNTPRQRPETAKAPKTKQANGKSPASAAGADPPTRFYPDTLGPRGPRTRRRVRHFPPAAKAALIPPKQTGLGPDGLFKRLSLWTSAVFSFFNPSLSLGEPCDPGTPSRFVSAIR